MAAAIQFTAMEEEEGEEEGELPKLLREEFRLSTICLAESEARRDGMDVQETVAVCIADLAFKYAEHLARDLQLFAWHARRKTVRIDDVIVSTHRNENLAAHMRTFCDNLIAKAPPRPERKRRKPSAIDDEAGPTSDLQEQEEQDELTSP